MGDWKDFVLLALGNSQLVAATAATRPTITLTTLSEPSRYLKDLEYLEGLGHKALIKNGRLYSMSGTPISISRNGTTGKPRYSTVTSSGKRIFFTNDGKFNNTGEHEDPDLRSLPKKALDKYTELGKNYNPVTRAVDQWKEDKGKSFGEKVFNAAGRFGTTITENDLGAVMGTVINPVIEHIADTYAEGSSLSVPLGFDVVNLSDPLLEMQRAAQGLIRRVKSEEEKLRDRIKVYETIGKVANTLNPMAWAGTAYDFIGNLIDRANYDVPRDVLMPWEGLAGLFGDSELGRTLNFIGDIASLNGISRAMPRVMPKTPKIKAKKSNKLYSTFIPELYEESELLLNWPNLSEKSAPWISLRKKDPRIENLIQTYEKIGAGKVAPTNNENILAFSENPLVGMYDKRGVRPTPITIAEGAVSTDPLNFDPINLKRTVLIAGNRGLKGDLPRGYDWNLSGNYHTHNTGTSPFTAAYYQGVGKSSLDDVQLENVKKYLESLPIKARSKKAALLYELELYEELKSILGERHGNSKYNLGEFDASVINDPVKRLRALQIIDLLTLFDGLGRTGYLQIQGVENPNLFRWMDANKQPYNSMNTKLNAGTVRLSSNGGALVYDYNNKMLFRQDKPNEVLRYNHVNQADLAAKNISVITNVRNPDLGNTILFYPGSTTAQKIKTVIPNIHKKGGKINYFK